jgi:hypothetical protein
MYVVSITADEYLKSEKLLSIETTRDEKSALRLNKTESGSALSTLRKLGYEPLLIRVEGGQ